MKHGEVMRSQVTIENRRAGYALIISRTHTHTHHREFRAPSCIEVKFM